jgi:hypothetical protein
MKFWKLLHWTATGVFIVLLLAAWLIADPASSPSGETPSPGHLPPIIFHCQTNPGIPTKYTYRLARLTLACAMLLASATSPAQAEEAKTAGNLRIAGGPGGKVYALMVKDMLAVCGGSVNFNSVASAGGLQNLTMPSANEADLAIVQFDTWQQMKGSDENIAHLQSVMPLHNNLLHVLTLSGGSRIHVKTIMGLAVKGTGEMRVLRKFSELKGMSAALVGSAQVMGQELEKRLRYDMQPVVAETDDDALAMLRAGQVQAVFTLGGCRSWPGRQYRNPSCGGLHPDMHAERSQCRPSRTWTSRHRAGAVGWNGSHNRVCLL